MPSDAVFHMDLTGLDAIEKELNKMKVRARNKALRKALSEGAEIVRLEAERNAPIGKVTRGWMAFLDDPGAPRLKDNIVKKVVVSKKRAWARVGFNYKVMRHGHLVEFGTRPHKIMMGDKRVLRHPGTRAQPFMQKAFAKKAGEAISKMGEILFDVVFKGL